MLTRCFSLFFLLVFFVSCGPPPKFSADEIAEQDDAWKKMIAVHDEVMPLVLYEMQETMEELEELGQEVAVEANDFHPRVQQSLADLKEAEQGMNDWMGRISDNQRSVLREKYEDHAAVMAFIDKEQVDIDQVAENINSSLATAKGLLKERAGN
ncbi:MAG: hypothetical protein AAFZ63_17270 [Bacteroidota bacterium]